VYWPFEEGGGGFLVEALVDFESFLDIDALHKIGAIAYNEVHIFILQRLKVRNHFLH
jgi:hypothetical protein